MTSILRSELYGHDCFKLAASACSEAYLLKLGKLCRRISKLYSFFAKIQFYIYMEISQTFFIPLRK